MIVVECVVYNLNALVLDHLHLFNKMALCERTFISRKQQISYIIHRL